MSEEVSKSKRYVQQVHADDGGEIILAASSRNDWKLFCYRCHMSWEINSPFTSQAELPSEIKPFAEQK